MPKLTALLGALLSLALAAAPAAAQTSGGAATPPGLPDEVVKRIRLNPDRFVESTVRRLFKMTSTGVVDAEVVDLDHKLWIARKRVDVLRGIFSFDLDGDLEIDKAEVALLGRHLPSNWRSTVDGFLAEGDVDKDGGLSRREAVAIAQQKAEAFERRRSRQVVDIMAFDVNADGKVTPGEIEELARRVSATGATTTGCAYPAPTAGAEIVLASGFKGGALSSVALSDPEMTTRVATLRIQPGEQALYVVAAARGPVIWRIGGAVERIEAFVTDVDRGKGVVGLDRGAIRFVSNEACFPTYFSSESDGKAASARGLLAAKLGRPVDVTLAGGALFELTVPSGALLVSPPDAPPKATIANFDGSWSLVTDDGSRPLEALLPNTDGMLETVIRRRARLYSVDAVIDIDPKAIIASGAVIEPYAMLPREAGLLQLARDGAIEITADNYYRIVKQIDRFPPGVAEISKAKFLIAPGVSLPPGEIGRSVVIMEATGECMSKPRCK